MFDIIAVLVIVLGKCFSFLLVMWNLKKIYRDINDSNNDKLQVYIFWCFVVVFVIAGVFLFWNDDKKSSQSQVSILSTNQTHSQFPESDEAGAIKILSAKKKHKPAITLIIANLGLNEKNDEWVYNLPQEVMLGFSPYAIKVSALIENAIKKGYSTMLHMPMQPADYPFSNLGPYCLIDSLNDQENISRTDAVLAKSNRVKGLYTNINEVFTESERDLKVFLKEIDLKAIGKAKFWFLYTDDKSIKNIDLYVKEIGLSRVIAEKIDIAIPDNLKLLELQRELEYAESLAKSRGGAIVLIYGNINYQDYIADWLRKLSRHGINLVSINTLFRQSREHDHKDEIIFMINDKKSNGNLSSSQ